MAKELEAIERRLQRDPLAGEIGCVQHRKNIVGITTARRSHAFDDDDDFGYDCLVYGGQIEVNPGPIEFRKVSEGWPTDSADDVRNVALQMAIPMLQIEVQSQALKFEAMYQTLMSELHSLRSQINLKTAQDIAKFFDIEDQINELMRCTVKIFRSEPAVSAGIPDPGEEAYVVFRVKVPADSDPDRIRSQKSDWHDSVLSLFAARASFVRLILEYR